MKAAPARNRRNASRKQRRHQHLLDVTVRARAAHRQRNNMILTCMAVLVLTGSIGYGLWYGGREMLRRFFWRNPDYNLAEVSIHTDGPLTRDQVLQATGIKLGANIFSIRLSAARKGLLALPQIEHAEIERILPNRIAIDIAERKPVAWLAAHADADPSADASSFLIDRRGALLKMKTEVQDYYHLPVICGFPVGNCAEGDVVEEPEVLAALELLRLTGENPARYQVRSIDVSRGYCLVVTDERHAKVIFPLENLAGQLDRLAVLFANVDASRREIQTVNLLVQRNVPVTFATPAAPDPGLTDAPATDAPTQPPGDDTPAPKKPAVEKTTSSSASSAAARTAAAFKKATGRGGEGTHTTRKATAVRHGGAHASHGSSAPQETPAPGHHPLLNPFNSRT